MTNHEIITTVFSCWRSFIEASQNVAMWTLIVLLVIYIAGGVLVGQIADEEDNYKNGKL